MKQCWMIAAVAFASVFAQGCQTDDYARQIVAPDTNRGRIDETFCPSAETMVAQDRISLFRQVPVADKATIDVWVIKARDAGNRPVAAKGTMLIIHSLYDSKATFPYRGTGERLAKMGYDVVLPDLRKHGRSRGDFITYGVKESTDLKAVIDNLVADKSVDPKVYAFGVNLGGAAAIQYAAIDPRCKGVMAVAPYQDFRGIVRHWLGRLLLNQEDYEKVIASAGKMADFDPNQASAVLAVKNIHAPLLLVHGMMDMSVPLDHSKAIFEAANEPKGLLVMGLEQIVLPAAMEDWIATHMDKLATSGVKDMQAATKPAGNQE